MRSLGEIIGLAILPPTEPDLCYRVNVLKNSKIHNSNLLTLSLFCRRNHSALPNPSSASSGSLPKDLPLDNPIIFAMPINCPASLSQSQYSMDKRVDSP